MGPNATKNMNTTERVLWGACTRMHLPRMVGRVCPQRAGVHSIAFSGALRTDAPYHRNSWRRAHTRARALLLSLALAAAGAAQAALFTDSPNLVIPDGGGPDVSVLSSTINVSGMAPTLSDISVVLNVSGGFNGDIYATLRGPGGVSAPLAVLLNRVGVTTSNPLGYS